MTVSALILRMPPAARAASMIDAGTTSAMVRRRAARSVGLGVAVAALWLCCLGGPPARALAAGPTGGDAVRATQPKSDRSGAGRTRRAARRQARWRRCTATLRRGRRSPARRRAVVRRCKARRRAAPVRPATGGPVGAPLTHVPPGPVGAPVTHVPPVGSWGGAVAAPAQGALFGAWTASNTGFSVEQREAQIGRPYKIVHRYHDWNDVFPSTQETAWAREGRILFVALEPRIYGSATVYRWADIAAGAQDAAIDAMAARIKALGLPVMMDFTHEPEEQGELGSPQEFAAAYRHVVGRFRAAGAGNVSWVWTVMGYSGHYGQYAGGLYPGDDVVDWIGWDPYNWYVCHSSEWKSFATKVSSFYGWLQANGHADKPLMLSEYGSAEHQSDPLAKGQWFRDALASLKAGTFPNLKALVYFDSAKTGECDWRLDTTTSSLAGYAEIAKDPYLNP